MNQLKSRKQNRLTDYDYSKNGYYYVTICTNNHVEKFGIIKDNNIILNQSGNVAKNSWLDLPNHHKNIQLDKFIIMPNHIHGIIIINNPVGNRPACSVNMPARSGIKKDNLSTIIGSYKSTVTKQINRINDDKFKWQKSFYDHAIRRTDSLHNIRQYIVNNPIAWDNDEYNIGNHIITVQAGLNPTGLVNY